MNGYEFFHDIQEGQRVGATILIGDSFLSLPVIDFQIALVFVHAALNRDSSAWESFENFKDDSREGV